jgi:hypothetical protein
MNTNAVDKLDSILKGSGQKVWGWVIYRGTYSSDSEWAEFMEKLKTETQDVFNEYGAPETVKNQHVWTVIEDRERLEDATKSDVRRMFSEWVHSPETAAEQPNAPMVCMARYQFCMHVDEASLRSVLDGSEDWHVNIIIRRWSVEMDRPNDEDPEDDEAGEDEGWPEIEGCTEVRYIPYFPIKALANRKKRKMWGGARLPREFWYIGTSTYAARIPGTPSTCALQR